MEPESYTHLKQEIAERMAADRELLDQLRAEIGPLRDEVRSIHPRTTTSISLVATDGGNNSLRFDPYLVQIVRVVDSSNNEYCLEAITPTTDLADLSARQFESDGQPRTALGELMRYLRISRLEDLSPMIPNNRDAQYLNTSWVQVYRELVEWAILFSLFKKDFGTDTLIIFDGLLRSKVFAEDFFKRYIDGVREDIEMQYRTRRRKLYLAGVAKHSKVLSRYRLAMALEGILTANYPAYVPVPSDIERKAYLWSEYALREDTFVGGKLFFVKFGSGPRDPIWPVDIYLPQASEAPHILGCMLADALNGFPVPLYPQCLQKAHANAALVDFDFDVLQDQIFEGIRQSLAEESSVLDIFRLQDSDPSQRRYE